MVSCVCTSVIVVWNQWGTTGNANSELLGGISAFYGLWEECFQVDDGYQCDDYGESIFTLPSENACYFICNACITFLIVFLARNVSSMTFTALLA